ncbi:MAG: phosphoglycerate kinase [Hyphomicrobiaceae bacterium]|nr:phosphoglycerate kinase [Hyphomicrobiaceae bacterium]
MSAFRSIEDADVAGKRVLVRADMNVPMQDGTVSDATRLERILPTLHSLTSRGAKVILMSHFGRPKGKRVPEMSLKPVAEKLDALLPEVTVRFATDCIGPEAEQAIDELADSGVLVLENTRFHTGEEANDPEFVGQLASLGDIYVNDAFSVSHRANSSTVGIASVLPAYAGLQMAAELRALSGALEHPERPVAAVVGGAKVSTKISVLTNLVKKLDCVIIGGGMANTFLYAGGVDIGKSLCEPDFADTAREIMQAAQEAGCEILLPSDVVVAKEFAAGAESHICGLDQVSADAMILDVGPETCAALKTRLKSLRTLLWNGPLGAFEIEPFGGGTFALAREAARLTKEGALITVAGGGDTVAALNDAGVTGDFTYVSTAGGAFLEWLEGKELSGVAALRVG